jgi:hypothetical protein
VLQPRRLYELVVRVSGKTVEVRCDGQDTYSARLEQPVPVGRVGLRPWRSLMRCDRFEVAVDQEASAS